MSGNVKETRDRTTPPRGAAKESAGSRAIRSADSGRVLSQVLGPDGRLRTRINPEIVAQAARSSSSKKR
jgi:hypothetical protein